MALRIPTYTRQVKEQTLPGAQQRVSPTSQRGVAQLGRGVEDVTRGAARVGADIAATNKAVADKQDLASIQDATAELKTFSRQLLEDRENGVAAFKGRRAVEERDQLDSIRNFWEKKQEQVLKRMTPRQRQKFNAMRLQMNEAFQAGIDRHIARESEAYEEEAHKNFLTSTLSNALKIVDSPNANLDEAFELVGSGEGAIAEYGRLHGWSTERIEQQQETLRSNVHIGLMDSMLEGGDYEGARQWLAQHKDMINPVLLQKAQIDEKIAKKEKFAISTQLADQARMETITEENPLGDQNAAVEAYREYLNEQDGLTPEQKSILQQEGEVRIAQQFDQARKRDHAADAPLLERLELGIQTGQGFGLESADYENLSTRGKVRYRQIRQHYLDRWRARRGDSAARRRAAKARKDALDELGALPMNELVNLDINDAYGYLPQEDRNELQAAQNRHRSVQDRRNSLTEQQYGRMVSAAAKRMGLKRNTGRWNQYHAAMNEMFTEFLINNPNHVGVPVEHFNLWKFAATQNTIDEDQPNWESWAESGVPEGLTGRLPERPSAAPMIIRSTDSVTGQAMRMPRPVYKEIERRLIAAGRPASPRHVEEMYIQSLQDPSFKDE